MKIAIHAPQMAPHITGTDRIAYNVLRELQKIDRTNVYEVACFQGDRLIPSVLKESNFSVQYQRRARLSDPRALPRRFARALASPRDRPDVSFSFHNLYAPLFKTSPTVVSIWDLVPLVFPKEYHPHAMRRVLYDRWVNRTVRIADHLVALSEYSKQDLTSRFAVPDEAVSVMYLAADTSFVPPPAAQVEAVRVKYDLPERFVLSIGSTEPRKNVFGLIQAYRNLPISIRQMCGLVVIGPQWHDRTTESWGISPDEKIRFTGYVLDEDLPAVYAAADVFAFLSLYEGFGLPPLEAMACGTPVLCSDRTSLPEVVGNAAVLVDPADAKAVSAELLRFLTDSQQRQEFSRLGLARAKHFSWRESAEVLHTVLTRVGGPRASQRR